MLIKKTSASSPQSCFANITWLKVPMEWPCSLVDSSNILLQCKLHSSTVHAGDMICGLFQDTFNDNKFVWNIQKDGNRSLDFHKCKILGNADKKWSAHPNNLNALKQKLKYPVSLFFIFIMRTWIYWPFSTRLDQNSYASVPLITI